MTDPFAIAREYLDRLREETGVSAPESGQPLALDHPPLPEPPAPPPVTRPECLADLDAEEALFRVYWRTLPDKALALRIWPSELRYYCRVKRLGVEIMQELEKRCPDLTEPGLADFSEGGGSGGG